MIALKRIHIYQPSTYGKLAGFDHKIGPFKLIFDQQVKHEFQ